METSLPSSELYAEVVLPLATPPMSFVVPETMRATVQPGVQVMVPLGEAKYYGGVVLRLTAERPPYAHLREVWRVVDPHPIVSVVQLRLWQWMAAYYMSPLGMVMRAALPSALKPDGTTTAEVLSQIYQLPRERVVSLHPAISGEAQVEAARTLLRRAKGQLQAFEEYMRLSSPMDFAHPTEVLRQDLGVSTPVLRSLCEREILCCSEREVAVSHAVQWSRMPDLSEAQQRAYEAISAAFARRQTVLLHGVTGSGKTEIYIRLMAEALSRGETVLYMLPEIALTAQLIARMEHYFGAAVTVYHSGLSAGRRAEVYARLSRSEGARLVLGVRSSVLLPLPRLGLVVVDEEHDSSFKQSDMTPRYHGRDTALMLASWSGARVVLGSATPSLDSYRNAQIGKYALVVLSERYGGVQLPQVIVSDTLQAARRGEKRSHFNKALLDRMAQTLERGEQVMLFQNRRGFSPYVECGHCGWTGRCPECNVTLTYHKQQGELRCHYCGYHIPLPALCPSCGTGTLDPKGFGTEKIEEELAQLFPEAVIGRLDADTTRSSRNYLRIVEDFSAHKMDILVGTQLITKGFDFEGVSLVGILNADNLLNYPDFRASERAFQLMMQVGGRAGRRARQGTVVIQTAQPTHPVICQVRESDFEAMVRSQFAEREAFDYPPFSRLILLTLRHRDPEKLRQAADYFGKLGRQRFGRRCLGPEPPPVDRVRGLYRLQFLLKFERTLPSATVKQELLRLLSMLHAHAPFRSVEWVADVDPQ